MDYSKLLSKTVVNTEKSGIRKFFDLMETMDDVVGLTVGQPDFVTPWHIREAGIESLGNCSELQFFLLQTPFFLQECISFWGLRKFLVPCAEK